jgi:hypothetical protein
VRAAAWALAFFAAGRVPAIGVADVEVFGLNRSPRLNLLGVGEATGLAAATAPAFARARLVLGDAAGDVDGDAASAAGEDAGRDFLAARCFTGAED